MNDEDLQRILQEHRKWQESGGTKGARADFTGQDLRGQDLQGRNLQKAIISRTNAEEVNLGRANLAEATFTEAQLNGAILSEARLEQAKFLGAHLAGADLSRAHLAGANLNATDLSSTNLEGADLTGAELLGAELRRANLHNAILRDADLTGAGLTRQKLRAAIVKGELSKLPGLQDRRGEAIGLQEHQFAGADVSNAKLPDSVKDFDGLKHAEEISRQAKTIFLMVIGACLFSWLTISTTTDLALILGSRSTPLPVIQTQVPIVGFYWAAPAILLGLYAYLHLYLQNLWTTLSNLPAVLPDGKPLDQKAYPWMATSLIRAYVPLLRKDRPRYSRASVFFTIVCAWCFVPGTILVFWARYLPRHDSLGTTWLVILVASATWWGIDSLLSTRKKLRGELRSATGDIKREDPEGFARLLGRVQRIATPTLATMILLFCCGIVSSYAIRGEMVCFRPGSVAYHASRQFDKLYAHAGLLEHTEKTLRPLLPFWWIEDAGNKRTPGKSDQSQGNESKAQSKRVEPPGCSGWAKWRLDSLLRADVIDEKISKPDGEWEKAFGQWIAEADRQWERRPSFQGPRLAGMNLRFARIESCCLVGAFLEGADLEGAILHKTDMRFARFWTPGAGGVNLQHAFLNDANLQGALLRQANLRGADLRFAKLQGANLVFADLQGANLCLANRETAYLAGTRLDRMANRARLRQEAGPEKKISCHGANLWGAFLFGADLKAAVNLTQDQVDEACCDVMTELPPHLYVAICVENGLALDGKRLGWPDW